MQTESYLCGGANSVRRQHYLEHGSPPAPAPDGPWSSSPSHSTQQELRGAPSQQLRWRARVPWLAGIAWVGHGSPVCLPTTCLLSSDSGGPVKAKEGSAPSFPGGATVEPEALWLEMMIKDGKLVWMRRGCGKGGPRGALVPGRKSLALEIGQSLPHQPNSLPNGLERQFWWERTLPRRQGKPCCSGGCGPSCHA